MTSKQRYLLFSMLLWYTAIQLVNNFQVQVLFLIIGAIFGLLFIATKD